MGVNNVASVMYIGLFDEPKYGISEIALLYVVSIATVLNTLRFACTYTLVNRTRATIVNIHCQKIHTAGLWA